MDDLTQCLYEFLLERRMGHQWNNGEYRACILNAKLQEEQMKSSLHEKQQKELDLLLDRIAERDSMEKTYLFQAALSLVRELNVLVGA